jgi:hypothetical protein
MILTTTATSVPSESSLSDLGNMLDYSRKRMTEYLQELMFLFEYFKFRKPI